MEYDNLNNVSSSNQNLYIKRRKKKVKKALRSSYIYILLLYSTQNFNKLESFQKQLDQL